MSKSSIKIDPAAATQVKIVDGVLHVSFSFQEKMDSDRFEECACTVLHEAAYEVRVSSSFTSLLKRKYTAKYGKDFLVFLVKASDLLGRVGPSRTKTVQEAIKSLFGFVESELFVSKITTLAASWVSTPEGLTDLQYFLSGEDLCFFGQDKAEAMLEVCYQHFYPKRDQVMAWLTPLIEQEAVVKASKQKAAQALKQKQMAKTLRARVLLTTLKPA